jgi:putative transposase
VYRYTPKRGDDTPLIDALLALVERHPRWGFPKLRKRLRKLGHDWNHKRIYRVYLELRLNMRRKHKRRLPSLSEILCASRG